MAGSVFGVRARGSTVGRELRGGLVTFVTMSYIVVLNPLILGSFNAADPGAKRDVLGAVLPVAQVAAVTALVAGVMTLLFGAIANYPFAIATGLGINTLVAVALLHSARPGQAGSLIGVGQIARVSSSKAARTRRFTGCSVPSS
jgi:AGZA family xanthine/uracil permease-like MFS transporter